MNYLRLLFPVVLGLSCHAEAGWFPDSPLQKTYLALAEHQPNLAWQELQIALGEQQLDPPVLAWGETSHLNADSLW
ncbi:DUF2861 family protein [Vibrio fluvialis]|nr:DUF2861 family protein [Vibrio fluvialis]